MSTDQLGTALRGLVDGAEDAATAPDATDLWAGGLRRRRTARAVPVLAAACVAVMVALLAWPSGAPRASVPADGSSRLTSFPATVAKPPFASSTLTPGVTAAVVMESGDVVDLHAVSPTGVVTRLDLPQALPGTEGLTLSPDGRWLGRGGDLYDLVGGDRVPSGDVRARLDTERVVVDRAPWWSPDSRRAFVQAADQGQPTSVGYVLGTDGSVTSAPLVAGGIPVVIAGWLDPDTLLAFVDMTDESGYRLEARTWRVGDSQWVVGEPDLTWAADSGMDVGVRRVSVSPDRTRIVVTAPQTDRAGLQYVGTSAMEFDARTGRQLPLDASAVDDASAEPDSYGWAGWGCRVGWRDERPVAADGDLQAITLPPAGPLPELSSRFDASCTVFAGDEVRGTPVAGGISVWQERGWTWGWRLLVLGAVVALVRWYSRRRAWRQDFREQLPPFPGPQVR
ncbi:hypothetical protein [Oryzobacter telluris]|uniref:hypothetical protein n=1 Tax=Oryzobacter telluris TaxID=3149179 RepID=UPI00370DDAB7